MSLYPLKRLVAETIEAAIEDLEVMDGTPAMRAKRVSACVWLASQAAAPWFDLMNVDQARALRAMGWSRHARDLLRLRAVPDERGPTVTAAHAKVLRGGLRNLEARAA